MAESIRKVVTSRAPQAIGPYSQAVVYEQGGLVFVSGQLGIDPASGEFAGPTVGAQTRQCLKNLANIIEATGSTMSSVIKTTVYLADMNDFGEMNRVYEDYFKEPHPARACVAVKQLPKGALVEIDAIAAREEPRDG